MISLDNSDKAVIKAALRKSFGQVIYAIQELDTMTFYSPSADGKWSTAQILGHLILSTRPINRALSTAKDQLKSSFGTSLRAPYKYDEIKLRYDVKLKSGTVQAPRPFVYQDIEKKTQEELLALFLSELNELCDHIDEWDERDLTTYQLPHPALGLLTLKEMIFFTDIHTDHHYVQISRAR